MYGMAIGYGIAAAGQEDKVGFKTISFVRMHRRLDLRFKLLVKWSRILTLAYGAVNMDDQPVRDFGMEEDGRFGSNFNVSSRCHY